MEQLKTHKEVITNREIERVVEEFRNAVECVPRGVCLPDEARIVVSKYYIVFVVQDGEVRLICNGPSFFVEVRANGWWLATNSWDMFVLKHMGKSIAYSPRIAVGREVYTADEFVEFVRKGFKAILSATNWV